MFSRYKFLVRYVAYKYFLWLVFSFWCFLMSRGFNFYGVQFMNFFPFLSLFKKVLLSWGCKGISHVFF